MKKKRHMQTVPPAEIFCVACGYPLNQLESSRCPECGAAFDRNNPRTVSLGSPLRRWQRLALRPMSWLTISLIVLATGGLVYLGGSPHAWREPWEVMQAEFQWPSAQLRPWTLPDFIFYVAVALWSVFIGWWLIRLFVRVLALLTARASIPLRFSPWRNGIIALALLTSIVFILYGWQDRIGRRWAARVLRQTPVNGGSQPLWNPAPLQQSPVAIAPNLAAPILRDLLIDLPTVRERMLVMGELVRLEGRATLPDLLYAAAREKDGTLLAWELRLISLWRDPNTKDFLIERLSDNRPEVRAAAADAIGILRKPSYSIFIPDSFFWPQSTLALECNPPIDVRAIVGGIVPPVFPLRHSKPFDLIDEPDLAVGDSVRTKLLSMMATGATADEREAAARALVGWPPENYRLRLAEWGVWVTNKGNLGMVKSQIDGVPPFVHRTGNAISFFQDYFIYPSEVFKPIIHVTANVPMAIDLDVRIRQGRPWFGYPWPDGFSIDSEGMRSEMPIGDFNRIPLAIPPAKAIPDDFTQPPVAPLASPREGYPWLFPHFRPIESDDMGMLGIYSLGLHWQSLIVCPERAAWMWPRQVPADAKYQWWSTLRDVPCSWVSSRGEDERFLYYDGPTKAAAPASAFLDEEHHRIDFLGSVSAEPQTLKPDTAVSQSNNAGLYVEVHNGDLDAKFMPPGSYASLTLPSPLPLHGQAVIEQFRAMLTRYGLTGPEADGLIRVWTPQFFQTEGRRFIFRMSEAEYDEQCPIKVRPAPTEMVRLGLILTEFDAGKNEGVRG